jgi:hypothetical protein
MELIALHYYTSIYILYICAWVIYYRHIYSRVTGERGCLIGCNVKETLHRIVGTAFASCGSCRNTETSKYARNNRITNVYSLFLGDGQRANELTQWDVFCAVYANQQ